MAEGVNKTLETVRIFFLMGAAGLVIGCLFDIFPGHSMSLSKVRGRNLILYRCKLQILYLQFRRFAFSLLDFTCLIAERSGATAF